MNSPQNSRAAAPFVLTNEQLAHIECMMAGVGIPQALHECTLSNVSRSFKSKDIEMLVSDFWHASWGMVGDPGIGKSGLLAAVIRKRIIEDLLGSDKGRYRPPVMWVDWPTRTDQIRKSLSRKEFDGAVANLDDIHEFLEEVDDPVLVIDDVGRERTGQTKSWATEKLELLLDKVWNNRSVILHWTSNSEIHGLQSTYTPALVSRMIGKAHEIYCPKTMPDRRLQPDRR